MADKSSNPFLDMFQNFGQDLNLPGPDINALMEAHRKNLQALQAAAQVGSTTSQAVLNKQREALEEALSDITQSVQAASSDPSSLMTSPMELAKKSFDATLKNASEVSEIVKQGNMDAYNILRDRVMESVDELQGKSKKG